MLIQDAVLQLLLKQPFYGYVAASVTPVGTNEVAGIGLRTAPVPALLYNPAWFEALSDAQAIGAVVHELLHFVLLHPYRRESRDPLLWTVACDMAVNEHLDRSQLPRDAVTVEKISVEVGVAVPRAGSAEVYYQILAASPMTLSFSQAEGNLTVLLKDGGQLKAQKEADGPEANQSAVRAAVADLVDQAGDEGEVPAQLRSEIAELYASHQVNWRNVLKRFLTGRGTTRVSKTYKRESKRHENFPGNKRTRGLSALLAVDESGSISDAQLAAFVAELWEIRKITGATIAVTRFDTSCTEPVPLRSYARDRARTRSGGTDFRPVFRLAEERRIPLLIFFTDGDGPAPAASDQKVLWVLTKDGKAPAAYGHRVAFGG